MLGIVAALVLLPAALLLADDYEFVPDTSGWVQVRRVDKEHIYTSFGNLDAAGNFVPDPRYFNVRGALSGMPGGKFLNAATLGGLAYEYRSGILIRVKYDAQTRNFVPEVGSAVIDFRDYLTNYREGVDPPVYNLPGIIHKKGTPLPPSAEEAILEILRKAAAAAPPGRIPVPNGPASPPVNPPRGARGEAVGAPAAPAPRPRVSDPPARGAYRPRRVRLRAGHRPPSRGAAAGGG